MVLARLRWGVRRVAAVAVVGLPVVAGCSAPYAAPASAAPVVVLRIATPVHEPVWSDSAQVLLALTADSRIARIDPGGSPDTAAAAPTTTPVPTVLSGPFPDVGKNISISPTGADVVYLPQPELDRVAMVSVADLRQVGTIAAGPSPSYVAADFGSKVLLALSEDGSTATPVDLQDGTVLPSQDMRAGPAAELNGPKRGRLVEYHVAGPEGITHYKGGPLSVADQGEIAIDAEKTTGDLVKVSRLYVAERGTDRLLAVDSKRGDDGLELVGQAGVGEPVHYLGADETRIYAATENKVVVFETDSFEGYRNGVIPVVETVDFRSALAGDAARNAPLSGLAVGRDHIYLTLQGQPYVLAVAKPRI